MVEDQFNQSKWPEEKKEEPKPLGVSGEKPDIDVRTFSSDVKSVEESGGGPPKPYTPKATPPESKEKVEEKKKSFGQVFSPPEEPASVEAPLLKELGAEELKTKKSKKGLFVGLLILIIVVGLAAIGYFLVYPIFFQAEEVTETPATAPPPSEAPSIPQVPTVPEVSETPETQPEAGTPAITEYRSLFETPADVGTTIILSPVNLSSYRASIEFLTATVPVFKEVVLKFGEGGTDFITFNQFSSSLVPDFLDGEDVLSGSFNPAFTFFTYTDENGTWPGYIASLSSNALSDIQDRVRNDLETSTNLSNLYLIAPGTPSTWKSGSVSGVANRYLAFSQSGASLNYGWLGDLLVVSTSFPGFQEALSRLK